MKNVLFIGPYRQFDGWGIASRAYIKALYLTGSNVCIRPVYLSNNATKSFQDKDLDQAEENVVGKFDTIIQNVLPYSFVRYGGVKNIGLCHFESQRLNHSSWIESINLLDELWVCSQHEKRGLQESGVTVPIVIMPVPRPNIYQAPYGKLVDLDRHLEDFKFYFIGENTRRKNIDDVLLAFHSEFIYGETVRLVLKTNNSDALIKRIELVKSQMGVYPRVRDYRSDIILSGYYEDNRILAVHQSCDCFVSAAYGEAFSLAAFDAVALGRTPIVNKNSGMSEFINNNNGFLVDSHETPAIDSNRPHKDLYRSLDTWYKIDIMDLRRKMREAYEMPKFQRLDKQREGVKAVQRFLPEVIAAKMVNSL